MASSFNKGQGRVAFVTGAARGIGSFIALELARRGIGSVLGVRNPQAAQRVCDAVRALDVPCSVERCDVTDAAEVERAVGNATRAFGRLDIIVNNAGVIEPQAPLAETDPATWAAAISANLVGPYHVLHAALPALMENGGAVVNISTGSAHVARSGWSAYCSSKAGLLMLGRSVLAEYGDRGVSVYSLQPGLVDTRMQERIREKRVNEIGHVPQEQLAPPALSAGIVAWLADERPDDLMGTDLSVTDPGLLSRAGVSASMGG